MKKLIVKACLILFIIFCVFKSDAQKKSPPSKYSAYLFAYFTGNEKSEESIHFALSNDGYHYHALNNNEPVIASAKISSTGVYVTRIFCAEPMEKLFTW